MASKESIRLSALILSRRAAQESSIRQVALTQLCPSSTLEQPERKFFVHRQMQESGRKCMPTLHKHWTQKHSCCGMTLVTLAQSSQQFAGRCHSESWTVNTSAANFVKILRFWNDHIMRPIPAISSSNRNLHEAVRSTAFCPSRSVFLPGAEGAAC